MNLDKKTAVVTGASYGIGKSIVEMLLKDSFKVYGISRTDPAIKSKNFIWLEANLYNESDIKGLANKVFEKKLELLVNNVGTHFEESAIKVSQESFRKMFELNFLAPIFVTKYLSEKLRKGLIVNISSTSDRLVEEGSALYCSSKAALDIYFDTVALENKNIKILQVLPDYVDTPLQHKISDKLKNFDWKQCVSSEEVADLIRDLITKKYDLQSGTKIIIVNNKTLGDISDPEKLWYYNVDTGRITKLK